MSPNTLSDRLKEVVAAGLLTRAAYDGIPPRVYYEPTAKAHDFGPVFESPMECAARHDLKPEPIVQAAALATA